MKTLVVTDSLYILVLVLLVSLSKGKDDIDKFYRPLDQHIRLIEETRTLAENDNSNSALWAFLGLLHYEMYSLWKRGGLADAITSFDRSLSLLSNKNEERPLRFALTLQKAITVSYLGRSLEALVLFDESLGLASDSALDRATVLIQKAGLLLNSPEVSDPTEAAKLYEEILLLNNCAVEAYWGYVTALKTVDKLSTRQWNSLLSRLKQVHQSLFEKGDYFEDCSHYSPASSDALHSVAANYNGGESSSLSTTKNKEVNESCMDKGDEKCIQHAFREFADHHANRVNLDGFVGSEEESVVQGRQEDDKGQQQRTVSLDELTINAQKGSSTLLWCMYLICDKLGNKAEAWGYLKQAHAAAKGEKKHDLQESINRFNHTTSHFVKGYWPPDVSYGIGSTSAVPVFIVGFFRSGSTLLETMLDAHPSVWGMGEDSIMYLELYSMQDDILKSFSHSTEEAATHAATATATTSADADASNNGHGSDVKKEKRAAEETEEEEQQQAPTPVPVSTSTSAAPPHAGKRKEYTNSINEVNEKLKKTGGHIQVISLTASEAPFSRSTDGHTGRSTDGQHSQKADNKKSKGDSVRSAGASSQINEAREGEGSSSSSSRRNRKYDDIQHDQDMKKYYEIVNSCAERILTAMVKRSEENQQHQQRQRRAAAGADDDRRQHGDAWSTRSSRKKKIVDKMLMNYRLLGFIHLVFPKAVIINTVRDPMDTLFSCYKNKFSHDGTLWAHDVTDLVTEYVLYLELMQHFRKELPPERIIDVSYEALVSSPEHVMRQLLSGPAGLGLAWDPAVLEYQKLNRTVHTASVLQVRKGIYLESVGVWRKYAQELSEISTELKRFLPRLQALGALPSIQWPLGSTKEESATTSSVPMNWDLSPSFNYSDQLSQVKAMLVGSSSATTDSEIVTETDNTEEALGQGRATGAVCY